MLTQRFISRDVLVCNCGFRQISQFFLQAAGQNRQTHNFNETNVFLLDMVLICMGMEHAHRMLLCGNVATQHQIQLIVFPFAAGNGGDGIMRLTIGESNDADAFVGIATPSLQNLVCQVCDSCRITALQTNDAHGPFDDTGFDILKTLKCKRLLDRSSFHSEGIMAALEVLMAQNRAAHDGQIRIGAYEIMGKYRHEVQ